MRKTYTLIVAILTTLVLVPSAQAAGLMDWLDEHRSKVSPVTSSKHAVPVTDQAELLTLEPGETEMFPKVSPDGRMLFVISSKRRQSWVSYRYAENGDPANVITDDVHALDTVGWKDKTHVYFLSRRAGSLGLWEKPADGQGLLHRLRIVTGKYTQVVLLPDGGLIAVRLTPSGRPVARKHSRKDRFNNWAFPGYRAEIVRVGQDGPDRVLAGGVNPALSPDGKWIAFSMPVGRSWHLFLMRTDGADLLQLTDARSVDVQPAWSPDGKWIVFTSNRAKVDIRGKGRGNWDIWAIGRDGRNLTQLTYDKGRDGGPSVGLHGRVFFHSDRKVSQLQKAEHEVKGSTAGFNIWTVRMPRS